MSFIKVEGGVNRIKNRRSRLAKTKLGKKMLSRAGNLDALVYRNK